MYHYSPVSSAAVVAADWQQLEPVMLLSVMLICREQ